MSETGYKDGDVEWESINLAEVCPSSKAYQCFWDCNGQGAGTELTMPCCEGRKLQPRVSQNQPSWYSPRLGCRWTDIQRLHSESVDYFESPTNT